MNERIKQVERLIDIEKPKLCEICGRVVKKPRRNYCSDECLKKGVYQKMSKASHSKREADRKYRQENARLKQLKRSLWVLNELEEYAKTHDRIEVAEHLSELVFFNQDKVGTIDEQ